MRDATLRCSEAAALTWADVEFRRDGSARMTVRRYLATTKRYAEIIRQKTFDWEDNDGGKSWGIRTMGKEHFFYKE